MKIYLIRHGETESNLLKRYCGSFEDVLTAKGVNQAKELALRLRDVKFNKIYTSPLERAVKSCQLIIPGEDYVKDERLKEMSFGIFENKSYTELKELYPTELGKWSLDWKGYALPQGESTEEAFLRVSSFMKELESDESLDNVLLVAHGGIIKLIYCYILNSLDAFWSFTVDNCSINIVSFSYGSWIIEAINK